MRDNQPLVACTRSLTGVAGVVTFSHIFEQTRCALELSWICVRLVVSIRPSDDA